MSITTDAATFTSIRGEQNPARQWLDKFHDEALLEDRPLQDSFIPSESKCLAGLKQVSQRVVHAYVEAARPDPEVTLDVD